MLDYAPVLPLVDNIPPSAFTQAGYDLAADLRVIAEQSADPQLYDLAADAFLSIGFVSSAQRMTARANHYRSIA